MNKFLKKAVCPKCGREQQGYYISPVCLCGHQLREYNGWEKACLDGCGDEFQALSVFKKRDLLRQSEWNGTDVKWQAGFRLLILVNYLILLFKSKEVMSEYIAVTSLAAVVGVILAADLTRIIVKTIYYQRLRKKDKQFFKQSEGK